MHDTAIFGFREKLLDAFIFDRVTQGWRDFREGHQNKPALSHSWMRDFQLLSVNDARPV